MRLLEFW